MRIDFSELIWRDSCVNYEVINPDHVVSIVVPWLENGDMHFIDCHPNSSLYLTVLFLTVLILCTVLVL